MPVTKTAKRALKGSLRKRNVNAAFVKRLEISLRLAQKTKGQEAINKAVSLVDRAVKKNIFHKNKAARIKKRLSSLRTIKSSKKTTKKVKK